LCLSKPIATEYEEVLKREKFRKLNHRKVRELLSRLRSQAEWVASKTPPKVSLPDPDDNKFLECAEEAGADFLITGNIKHFPPGKFKVTRVLNPAQFLSIMAQVT
jgi:putative PIN family toxin of toxin-antitoxin system